MDVVSRFSILCGCVFESILILNYFVFFENIIYIVIYIYISICILLFFGDASPHELYIKSFFASGNHRRLHNERLLWPTPLPGLRCER